VAYDRSLEIDPNLIEARVDRALVELEMNQNSEALADLQAAVAAGCKEVGVLAALAEALSRLGHGEEADEQFRLLLERNHEDPLVLVARGMTRLESDPAAAARDFESVLDRNPRNATAHFGMALLIRSRDPLGALAHLDAALEADPNLISALQLRSLERARVGARGALDDVDRLTKTPAAVPLYNAACALALYGTKNRDAASLDRAVEILTHALSTGFPASRAESDPDLRALKERADFNRLMARFRSPPGWSSAGTPPAGK
jgi:tetratricopeptide (TPR) repeat protein